MIKDLNENFLCEPDFFLCETDIMTRLTLFAKLIGFGTDRKLTLKCNAKRF